MWFGELLSIVCSFFKVFSILIEILLLQLKLLNFKK